MPEFTADYPPYSGVADPAAEQSGTVDVAKDQASTVAHGAAEAGQQVAATAKEQAQNVVAEAGSQAKDLLTQARSELAGQAGTQQQRLASGLRSLADELGSMASNSQEAGLATDLARQAADHTHQIASWFDSREPGHVIDEVKSFARQRPGTFLLIAAVAGLAAGRLTRGVKDSTGSSSAADGSAAATAPSTTPGSLSTQAPVPTLPPVSTGAPGPSATIGEPFASSQDGPGGYPVGGDYR